MTTRLAAIGIVLLALAIVPAPLLPPHRLAEAVHSMMGIGWKAAYLIVSIGLQVIFHGSIGILAAITVNRAPGVRGRLLQIVVLPVVVVGIGFVIRFAKLGHLPVWVNLVVPVVACVFGVGIGLGFLHRRWLLTLFIAVGVVGAALWGLLGGTSAALGRATEMRLQRLVAGGPEIPPGNARFGVLLQKAFASAPADLRREDAVQENRAAILAWGIAVGHERLAPLVGLDDKDLVRRSAALGQGTTLHGREDWPRHYALSAALAVLEHPLISDAGGLMKEQLDALTGGSGFSFGDLMADRAGVRFAIAATESEAAAKGMHARLQQDFAVDDFFPVATDLPENLTVEQFRRDYGGVGSQRYRQQVDSIEILLDRCIGLRQQ